MSEDVSHHDHYVPEFITEADSADPIRDPFGVDEGDPDPFDSAVFEVDSVDPFAVEEPPLWSDGDEADSPTAVVVDHDLYGPDALMETGSEDEDHYEAADQASSPDSVVDPIDVPDVQVPSDDVMVSSDDTTVALIDELGALATDGEVAVGLASMSLTTTGWEDGGFSTSPEGIAWAVPVTDPDPEFIDVDLL